ncbi:hypothetical protein [Streptomyces sp. NPDC024089]
MTWTAPRIARTTADGDQLNVPSTSADLLRERTDGATGDYPPPA